MRRPLLLQLRVMTSPHNQERPTPPSSVIININTTNHERTRRSNACIIKKPPRSRFICLQHIKATCYDVEK